MMKWSNGIVLVSILISQTSFAQTGARGGDDGLDYRLASAKTLASKALRVFAEKMPVDVPQDIKVFYTEYSDLLNTDMLKSRFLIRPAKEVTAAVGDIETPRKAITGFTRAADVLISRELNEQTSISELTAILIHEVGHHTGFHDENESIDETQNSLFLNRFAAFVLSAAINHDLLFQAKLFGTVSIAQLAADDSLAALGVKHLVHGSYYSFHLNFKTRVLVLRKIDRAEDEKEKPEPEFAKKIHEKAPNFSFKISIPEDPEANPDVYAKTVLTDAELNAFFEVNKKPITLEVPSVSDKNLYFQVTFSHWTEDFYPLATQISITPVVNRNAVWADTIDMLKN